MTYHSRRRFYAIQFHFSIPPTATVHVFTSRATRDAWVTKNTGSDDRNRKARNRHTRATTRKYARAILQNPHNHIVLHDDLVVCRRLEEAIERGDTETIDNFVEIQIEEWYDRMEDEELDEHDLLYDSMPCCLFDLRQPPNCQCRADPNEEIPF